MSITIKPNQSNTWISRNVDISLEFTKALAKNFFSNDSHLNQVNKHGRYSNMLHYLITNKEIKYFKNSNIIIWFLALVNEMPLFVIAECNMNQNKPSNKKQWKICYNDSFAEIIFIAEDLMHFYKIQQNELPFPPASNLSHISIDSSERLKLFNIINDPMQWQNIKLETIHHCSDNNNDIIHTTDLMHELQNITYLELNQKKLLHIFNQITAQNKNNKLNNKKNKNETKMMLLRALKDDKNEISEIVRYLRCEENKPLKYEWIFYFVDYSKYIALAMDDNNNHIQYIYEMKKNLKNTQKIRNGIRLINSLENTTFLSHSFNFKEDILDLLNEQNGQNMLFWIFYHILEFNFFVACQEIQNHKNSPFEIKAVSNDPKLQKILGKMGFFYNARKQTFRFQKKIDPCNFLQKLKCALIELNPLNYEPKKHIQ